MLEDILDVTKNEILFQGEIKMETIRMWQCTPSMIGEEPVLEYYPAKEKKTDACIVIFPGGGYDHRATHEGEGYAKFLNSFGMDAFVLQYRVSPYKFPIELLDARRCIRYVRANAEKFGINSSKIGVMGSSAGGHLAALLCTYSKNIENENVDEIDNFDYIPNFQVLCYPVIAISDFTISHLGSTLNLLGNTSEELEKAPMLDPYVIANKNTPKAFVWHTSEDAVVNVCNSLKYGEKLRMLSIPFEMHIFPNGPHGLGLAEQIPHVAQWQKLFISWLKENTYL